MAEIKMVNETAEIEETAAREAGETQDELYSMPDEVCCSPEFPQGCISAE